MSRARRRTIKGLVIAGSFLAFLSVLAIWTERQALNTDDWVETSDKLIQNETIRTAVADYLVDQLYENVDVKKEVEDILPGDTQDLAGPVSGGLRQVAGSGAERVLETSTAQELWRGANRTAHEELVAVLEDKRREGVETGEGEVTLDLATLVTNLAGEVGIGEEVAEKLPEDAGEITILRSDELGTAQDIVVLIKGLAIVFSLLTFLAFALAIYISRAGRWVTVLFCGVGLIAAAFAVIIFREVAGGIVMDQLVDEEGVKPAAEATWSIATSLMTSIATTVIVIGVLFGIAGWLASPTDSARTARRVAAPVLREYPAYVYSGLAILVGIYFLSAPTQNLRSFLTTLVIAGLAAFGIHELRKQSHEEFPDADMNDVFGRTRDRVAGAVKDVKGSGVGERVSEGVSKLRLPEVRMPSGEKAGAPAPPSRDEEDTRLERLERLGELKEKGILTDEEFAAEKARVLGGGESA